MHVPKKIPPLKAPKPKKQPTRKPVLYFQPETPETLSAPETSTKTEAKMQLKVPPLVKPKPKRKADSPER